MARSSFFLTTSPDSRAHLDRLMMLSSSPLPEITELATKKPKATALRSGSAAVPIPATASTTFTSAADLLRSVQAGLDDSPDLVDEPERPAPRKAAAKRARKTTKAPKRVAKEVIILSSDGATPNSNDNNTSKRAGVHDQDGNEGDQLGTEPWKRDKVSADTCDADLSAKAVEPQTKPKVQRKKKNSGETVSKHFAKKDGANKPDSRISTPETINMEQAVQRRRDWTPPREDNHPDAVPNPLVESSTNPLQNSPPVPSAEDEHPEDDVFRNLRDAYAHKATAPAESNPDKPQPITLGKRKVIEMISVGHSSKQTTCDPSVKQKAPKKKARTITDLATAAYASKPVGMQEDTFKEDSILEYLDISITGNVSQPTTGKAKGKTTKVTKKKAPPKQPVLLSPKAALRQTSRQDFVFGTSSQLVREESPTFLRDLQAALRASNVVTSENAESVERLPQTNDLALQSAKRARGLWSVSARDEDGKIVDIEVIDFQGSPFPEDDAVAILDPWKDLPPEERPAASGTETKTAEPSLIEIDSMPAATSNTSSRAPVPKSHFFVTQPKLTINAAAAAAAEGLSDSSITETHSFITGLLHEGDAPPPSNQEQSQDNIRHISPPMSRKALETRPNYELFTDAKLAKEVHSFGFKAIKSRSGMLALLNQCWESRNATPIIAAASFSTSARSSGPTGKKKTPAADPAATSPAPRKPRARTKKVEVATNDSAAANGEPSIASPPKPRGRPRKDVSAATGRSTTATMAPPPKAGATVLTPKRRRPTAKKAKSKEIVDSDLDGGDSAGLSSPEEVLTSPGGGAVDISINEDTEMTLDLSPTAQQSTLFSHITRAVTTSPRTTDPDNPSWHEKMLMYDPVILEDLAAWLNAGQLTRVGYDGEVSPMDVKKWCESKSVCCLWSGTWRGKERRRL